VANDYNIGHVLFLNRLPMNEVADRELNITAVHPLTGRQLPMFVVTCRQFGEYNDVDLGQLAFGSQLALNLILILYIFLQ